MTLESFRCFTHWYSEGVVLFVCFIILMCSTSYSLSIECCLYNISRSSCYFYRISPRFVSLICRLFVGLQDESDEMLSRGFKDQIYDVYRYLPPDLQVGLMLPDLWVKSFHDACLLFTILLFRQNHIIILIELRSLDWYDSQAKQCLLNDFPQLLRNLYFSLYFSNI